MCVYGGVFVHRHSILRNRDWNLNKFRVTTIVDTSGVNMASS